MRVHLAGCPRSQVSVLLTPTLDLITLQTA